MTKLEENCSFSFLDGLLQKCSNELIERHIYDKVTRTSASDANLMQRLMYGAHQMWSEVDLLDSITCSAFGTRAVSLYQ